MVMALCCTRVVARRRAQPVSTWSSEATLDSPQGRGAPGHASGRRLNRWWEVSANGHSLAGDAGEGFEEVAEGGDAAGDLGPIEEFVGGVVAVFGQGQA